MSKKTTTQGKIAEALAVPEDDIDQPTRRRPHSFNAQVADLRVGETASKAQPLAGHLSLDEIRASLPVLRTSLRNNVTKVVQRAREATCGEYRLEVTDVTTHDRNWFLLALVTRIE